MRTVIVGIGNDFRGDDGAGLVAARLLKNLPLPEIEIVELNGEVTRLLDHLREKENVILIDAVQSQQPPGTVHRFDASHGPLPEYHNHRSTHGMSVGTLLELARAQGFLPPRVVVYGIEAESFEPGEKLSSSVEGAVLQLIKRIETDLHSSEF